MRNRDTVSVQLEKYPAVVRGFSVNICQKESRMHKMPVFTEPGDTEDHALERAVSRVSFQALRHNFPLRFHAFNLRGQAVPSAPPHAVCVCVCVCVCVICGIQR